MSDLCSETAAYCICNKSRNHVAAGDEVHTCSTRRCGGSWKGTYASSTPSDFEIITFPSGIPPEDIDTVVTPGDVINLDKKE